MTWSRRAFCECGWSTEPSFGDVWFAQKDYPCCPDCGASAYGYVMRTVIWSDEARAYVARVESPIKADRRRTTSRITAVVVLLLLIGGAALLFNGGAP